jgi:pyruvate formate lyase activating enzyme
MTDAHATPLETLDKAKQIAEKYLDYVYVGNVSGESNTLCPKCKSVIIRRSMLSLVENKMIKDKCFKCNHMIAGVWA